ncbi:penicillin-binding protein 1A [Pararhodobacter oceanensis]|uniref:Penicillin-binding protein 1A n=1 Tax=Pararhodobacter oceanensis TaxID=2172121 RepID=A0A2T8HQU4_9RHOB|nr:PBP1A family penicillin-binding protein [Pararhodobacter oceanensis]PVH27662.1 penicillin-binding protein [Pararhodobacter oceanensis]
MTRAILSFFGSLFSFIVLGLFFGALTVGGVVWVYTHDLPSTEQLANYSPPTISRIYSGEGRLIDEFARERRLFTPIEDIPPLVRAAFISAEDRLFYEHEGFNPLAMVSALRDAITSRGQNVRGASTITQQVMKNFLLSSDRTIERKIREIILAWRVEQSLSKDQILELYLNEIFLGQNSFGVAAAAQTYFNKTLEDLTIEEMAFLAALPQAPSEYHPVRARERVTERRNWIIGQMVDNDYITEAEAEAARAQPLDTVQSGDIESFRESLPERDYFTDEIRRQLSSSFGEEEFFTGGLSIRATVHPQLQVHAAHALQRALESYDRSRGTWRGTGIRFEPEVLADEATWREALAAADVARDITLGNPWYPAVVLDVTADRARLGIEGQREIGQVDRPDIDWLPGSMSDTLQVGDVVHVRAITSDEDGSFMRWSLRQVPEVQGAFMAMDVNTGRVIAIQGGFSYQQSGFNRATQARRQPGSAFKPFVYAAALDSGFTPATIVIDAPIEIDTGDGIWRPQNASREFYGPTPVRMGIEQSRNLMTVRLAQEVGMDVVAGYAERFGVYDRMQPFLANSLGAQETSLFRMVAAYAMFANGGERVEPTLVDRVQDRWGRTVYRHDQRQCVECSEPDLPPGQAPWIASNRQRVMDPITAYQLTSMMQGVVQRGTATRVRLPVPVAGKTGTTNDTRDVWFVGYTSNIVAGCYIGFDRPRSLGRGVSGGGTCAPVFTDFMRHAVEEFGGGRFEVPPGGHFIRINRFTGERMGDDASGADVVAEYFRDGEEPVFGVDALIDGGFMIGGSLPVFSPEPLDGPLVTEDGVEIGSEVVEDDSGGVILREGSSFGTLSSGGLY